MIDSQLSRKVTLVLVQLLNTFWDIDTIIYIGICNTYTFCLRPLGVIIWPLKFRSMKWINFDDLEEIFTNITHVIKRQLVYMIITPGSIRPNITFYIRKLSTIIF